MARTLLRQSQIDNTTVDVVSYRDALQAQLISANNPEIASGVTLVAAEIITFSLGGNVVTLAVANPKTAGVVPGDSVTISGSGSDDGTWTITAVDAGTVVVDHVFAAADGGYALGTFKSVRDLLTDLNFLRSQIIAITGETNWFDPPTAANSMLLKDKKVLYATENYTNIAIPTANKASVSGLGLSGFADSATTAEGKLVSTSLPTAGGGYKSEGKHWVDIVDALTGEPITIGGNRVYGYYVVDSVSAPTTQEVYFVYFNNDTDGEVLVTNLSTQKDQTAATHFELTYITRTNMAAVTEDFGLHPTHIEAAVDKLQSLQSAYNTGQTIALAAAKGDLAITLDTGTDFTILGASANYLSTDIANTTLDLGDATVQVDVNGNFAVTGTNTFDVGTGQATFAGNVDADAGLDVTGTTNLGDGGTTNYAQFGATGDLSFVGAADTISKSDAALNIETTGQGLNLSTLSSGTLAITSAGVLDMGGASVTLDSADTLSIDAADDSNVSVTGGDLELSTLSSGDLILSSAGELTFNDLHWSAVGLPFADAVNTAFTGSAAGAVSLVDAINQVAAEAGVGESMAQGYSTPGVVNKDTNVTIPGALAYTLAADFVSDFIIFVNGVKMINGVNQAAGKDVYPGSSTTTMRFSFKLQANDVVSAVKIS